METLDKHFRHLASAAFKAHGFATADLLSHWPDIVGSHHAAVCRPERIKWPKPKSADETAAGTLHLKAAPGRTLDVQYASEHLKERINQFLGFQAIARIRVMADTAPPSLAPIHPPASASPELPNLANIGNPELRAALSRLANGLQKTPPATGSPQAKQGHGNDPQL